MTFIEEVFTYFISHERSEMQALVWSKWGECLKVSGFETVEHLSDFQLGFLSMLSEKYEKVIQPLVIQYVKPEFEEWYEEVVEPEVIIINAFNLHDLKNGIWEIAYEDDQEDLIVHLIMKNWEFEYTTRTG